MNTGQPARTTRYAAMAVLLAILALRTVTRYVDVAEVLPAVRIQSFADYFKPGLVEAVEWIRNLNPPAVRMGAPYQHDRELYERVAEMLYPIPVKPLGTDEMEGNELCVTPSDRPLPKAAEARLVFRNQYLSVWRAEP